jgi:hypothetical protein
MHVPILSDSSLQVCVHALTRQIFPRSNAKLGQKNMGQTVRIARGGVRRARVGAGAGAQARADSRDTACITLALWWAVWNERTDSRSLQ